MKSYAISGLAFVIGIGLSFTLSGLLPASAPPASFSYATATPAKRLSFLAAEAAPITVSLETGLARAMTMAPPSLDAEKREIHYRIRVDAGAAGSFDPRRLHGEIYPQLCPGFIGTRLARHDATVIQEFVAKGSNKTLMTIVLSKPVCRQFI